MDDWKMPLGTLLGTHRLGTRTGSVIPPYAQQVTHFVSVGTTAMCGAQVGTVMSVGTTPTCRTCCQVWSDATRWEHPLPAIAV